MATWCGVGASSAQSSKEAKGSQLWTLDGLRAGYCVRFLVEPKQARRLLDEGFDLVTASQDSTLHSALQQIVRGQPEFRSWTPSRLCFYFADAFRVGSRRIAEKDPQKYQMLGVWSLATREKLGTRQTDLALDLFASRNSLRRAAENNGVPLNDAHSVVADQADTTSDIYSVKLERTRLIWQGRPAGDSVRLSSPIREAWRVPRRRGGLWAGQFAMKPAWSRALVGSLTVEGKGDLAKALKASPIRFVGPLYWGGAGELVLVPDTLTPRRRPP